MSTKYEISLTTLSYVAHVNRMGRKAPRHGQPSGVTKLQKLAGREDARDGRHQAKLETCFKRHHESLGRVVTETADEVTGKITRTWAKAKTA